MAKSDFQYRNNGLYSGLLSRAADNMVGTGSTIQVQTSDEEYNTAKEESFRAYYEDAGFTVNGLSGPQSQRVALLDCFRGGNSLWYKSDGGWQMFEPAQLGTPHGYSTDIRKIAAGVELLDGKPSRYWVGNFSQWGYLDLHSSRGLRADKCFLMGNREYASGWRSVPPLASMISRFVDLDGYLEAELFGARAAASILGVVKSADKNVKQAFGTALKKGAEDGNKNNNIMDRVNMTPGKVVHLMRDEEFKLETANRPGGQFKDFVRLLSRVQGIKLAMPLEIAYLDFSDSNFSAAQMLLNQCYITWRQWQEHVICPLVKRHYLEWDQTQTEVQAPKSLQRASKFTVVHHKPRWANYAKEAAGRKLMLETGAISLEDVAGEMGHEMTDVVRKRVNQYKAVKAATIAAGYPEGTDEYKECFAYGIGNLGKYSTDLIKAGFLDADDE